MERTRKPWEAETSNSGRAKGTTKMPQRPNILKEGRTYSLHDDLLRTVIVPETKRNRQRDAYKKSPHDSSVSLPNMETIRPLSTSAIPSSSRSNHPRHATEPQTSDRPRSEPVMIEPILKPREPVASTSASAAINLPEESPPPYEQTDWDAFLARMTEAPESATYEDLLLLAEVNGPAAPTSTRNMGSSEFPFDVSVASVELISRRTTKEGRAKLKLAIAGIRVDKCGICLTQFRPKEKGAFPECQHCFHETCLQRWVARSPSCPVCRVDLRPG